ncbi:RNA-directed DNA polymerase from mobile element jockey [Trichonephila clavipes]|nr:RNA-directed DNA polymerase from mobile element jockey [Trichonephila clavipes]
MWGSDHSSRNSNIFIDWLTDSNSILLNTTVPTYRNSTGKTSLIELTICSSSLYGHTNCYVSDCFFDSDHSPVITEFSLIRPSKRLIKKIDWQRVKNEVQIILSNPEENIDNFTDTISKIIYSNTRVVQISNKSFPPWWNGTCHNFYKLKKKFRKKAIRSISPQLWIKYKQYASKLRFHIKNAKRLYWDNICNNVSNPKIFFNILKKLSNTKKIEHKYNILQVNNRYITQRQIQANIFADFFASKNAYHEPIHLDFFHKEDSNLNKTFHIFEIHRAIKLSKNSTPGADHITASFLKHLDRNGCEIRYFQDLFDNAIVPNSWKHAVILPIPKQCKDKTRISSYSPIALTSIFSKTFERVLTNRLSYFLTTERKLHPQHYGFVPFKDSRSATYLIHKAIMDAKLKNKYFVGVSLDIKSAYDSVYVDGLLYKCLQIGITGKTAIWIHKFLTYRSFQIKWRGYLHWKDISPRTLNLNIILVPETRDQPLDKLLRTVSVVEILRTVFEFEKFNLYEMDIEVLKKIRTPVRRAATELSNSIKIEIEKENASSDLIELLAKLIDKEKQLENVDKDITILTNMDDLEKEIEKQQEYRDSIITCKVRANKILKEKLSRETHLLQVLEANNNFQV